MKILSLALAIYLLLGSACQHQNNTEQWKQEILQTEAAFAKMASEKGMKEAFLQFAANDAVLNRNNNIIRGKKAIKNYFDQQTLTRIELAWNPDFIDVSASGDLAYTYGRYIFSAMDSDGISVESEGIFHTVWKRQPDGNWKFVWD